MKTLPNIYPDVWKKELKIETLDYLPFRNLMHFKHFVSNITQIEDNKCDVSYSDALSDLMLGKYEKDDSRYESVRNLVRKNLLKRGLITQEIYENFKYSTDGIVVDYDVGKYAAGEPDCVITPSVQYVDFFHELYINISYRYDISDIDISKNINKLLATIEELERQHIFIKITLILACREINNKNNFLSVIPLFSHREFKTVEIMSSVLNNRLLRKFFFAIFENKYGDELSDFYGRVLKVSDSLSLNDEFNEIEFFTEIKDTVERRL